MAPTLDLGPDRALLACGAGGRRHERRRGASSLYAVTRAVTPARAQPSTARLGVEASETHTHVGFPGYCSAPSSSSEGFQERPGVSTAPNPPPESEPHPHQPVWLESCNSCQGGSPSGNDIPVSLPATNAVASRVTALMSVAPLPESAPTCVQLSPRCRQDASVDGADFGTVKGLPQNPGGQWSQQPQTVSYLARGCPGSICISPVWLKRCNTLCSRLTFEEWDRSEFAISSR